MQIFVYKLISVQVGDRIPDNQQSNKRHYLLRNQVVKYYIQIIRGEIVGNLQIRDGDSLVDSCTCSIVSELTSSLTVMSVEFTHFSQQSVSEAFWN